MTSNLDPNSHEPLIDSALIGLDLSAEHHLANCHCCQGEREKTEQALREFADLQREQANRPEPFWENQAASIREARAQISQRSPLRTALVPALALLLLLALQLTPQKESSPKPVQQTQSISDHARRGRSPGPNRTSHCRPRAARNLRISAYGRAHAHAPT